MEILDFLKSVFGPDLSISGLDWPRGTPYFLRDGYTLTCLSWGDARCALLAPVNPALRLPAWKKHLRTFQKLCPLPCALLLDSLTAQQRRSLVESGIPFVSPSQQLFLPFWGSLFTERFRAERGPADQMAPGTQLVFLYLYYREDAGPVNLTGLARALTLSKATCTRAVQDLAQSGLITLRSEGTNKWITPVFEKPELLRRAFPRMKSPVERLLYLRSEAKMDGTAIKSGIRGLADRSMVAARELDGAIAVSRKHAVPIPAEDIISREEFLDFGGRILEVWSYDPALLEDSGRVDDISLLLSLQEERDERIQMALDEIRIAHGLPVQEEE